MKMRVKKLHKDAKLPKQATEGACAFDLSATSIKKVYEDSNGLLKYIEYGTGIAIQLPKGYCALAMPRSSVSDTSLLLSNGVGLIDQDYRGEITFRFRCNFSTVREYGLGDRIGQLLILPLPHISLVEVDELDDTKRGSGGYGSTGQEYL